MKVPLWLSEYLTVEDFDLVEAVIAEVEQKTSGEIVPVVVRRSSDVGHVPVIMVLLWACLFSTVIMEYLWWQDSHPVSFWVLLIIFVLGCGLSWRFARGAFWQRLFTRKADMHRAVLRRAELEFYRESIRKTQAQTGVLLFVSILEHKVVVLADEAINSKVTSGTWQQVVELVVDGIRSKSLAQGLCSGIRRAGEILTEHFPANSEDKNELANFLRLRSE